MNPADQSVLTGRRTMFSPAVVRALVWGGAAGAIAAAVRYGLIDLDFFRKACDGDTMPLWCRPRQAITLAADAYVFGGISVVCGLYGLVKPGWTRAATIAVVFGAMGLALYNAGPAALGLVFGLAVIARERS
jgi:hypothetical protein